MSCKKEKEIEPKNDKLSLIYSKIIESDTNRINYIIMSLDDFNNLRTNKDVEIEINYKKERDYLNNNSSIIFKNGEYVDNESTLSLNYFKDNGVIIITLKEYKNSILINEYHFK